MSNVTDVNRTSAPQPKVRALKPTGNPNPPTKKLPSGGRDPRKGRR